MMTADTTSIPYDDDDLLAVTGPRTFRGRQLDQIAFPLGGIGTGAIALGGWGQLRDFEIFNRPEKGRMFRYTFFTLHCRQGDQTVTRVLQGPVGGADFTGPGRGVGREDGAGLPHFREASFVGRFPFAQVNLSGPDAPLDAVVEAYNPFIPLNPDDSSLPAALFNIELTNPGRLPVEAVVYANLENRAGHPEVGQGRIEWFESESGARGLRMSSSRHTADSPRWGELALATTHDSIQVQTHWFRGAWFDSLHRFWDQACRGALDENREPAEIEKGTDVGSIGLCTTVAPGDSVRLPVWIVWHNPNFEHYWSRSETKAVWRNWYATRFACVREVVDYLAANSERLEKESRLFTAALYSSTLPGPALDAIGSQLAILKSTTCLRLEDGTFYGFEGSNDAAGCCEGTCTHVWNYAQALAYLFPSLERSVREADYEYNLHEDGHMTFRLPLPLGTRPEPKFHAAADGQMGGVLKTYRDWLLCGDDDWLRRLWPRVQRALEYAWRFWDADKDGVMEGVQHNTYDIEFYGPNTMMGSFYLGALRAAEEMARHLGDADKADEYRALFERGRELHDRRLFRDGWYVQDVRLQAPASHDASISMGGQSVDPENPDYPKYQYGEGCLSDQLIGQWYARMLHLGDLFDPEHVVEALESIFRHNWRPDLSTHANPQRIYALNDEAGLLLCTWPRGGRPGLPFVYSDEVWCGIEYQVASHLIYEGLVREGLAIVKGVRDRHDGQRRNPWNEFECGHHYARSLASYALLLACSGFFYSAAARSLCFTPRIHADDFSAFFSVEGAWGVLSQKIESVRQSAAVRVLYGELELHNLMVGLDLRQPSVAVGGDSIEVQTMNAHRATMLRFAESVRIERGQSLTVEETRVDVQDGGTG